MDCDHFVNALYIFFTSGCNNTEELWELLISKKTATTSHFIPSLQGTLSGGFTPAVEIFDYQWFGVSEWEASTMDPQQSMLLHTTWECLQNAGLAESLSESQGKVLYGSDCGVFVGISMDNDAHYLSHSSRVTPLATSITSSIAANRIARVFNLKGPVMSVDTACASSLCALDVACKSLRDEDCSAALVCGVNTLLDSYRYALLNKMGVLSPDNRCKVFDSSANGYVRGEGCGAILLMPLAQAEREGRRILAVVKSTISNNNGASSATLTSPSGKDQEILITKALRKAHLSAKDVAYVEAHGTGTKLGDPIEVDTIQAVFGSDLKDPIKKHSNPAMSSSEAGEKMTNQDKNYNNSLVVGSIKANIGHLETGAGIAGLVKTVMVLEHSLAPGNALLEKLNPCFRLSDNICITSETKLLKPVDLSPAVLAAVVNSFGFGGTNATAVLQQYGPLPHMAQSQCALLFSTDIKSMTAQALNEVDAVFSCLGSRFLEFRKAVSTCDTIIKEITASLGEMCLDAERATFMKFYYALTTLFQSLGVQVMMVGGLDILGEILSLVIAKALDLHHAMILILTSWSPAYAYLREVEKIIHSPTIPIFSCVMEKVCHPSESEIGSSKYCVQMISKLRVNPLQPRSPLVECSLTMDRLLGIVEKENAYPLLCMMADSPSSVSLKDYYHNAQVMISVSEFHCMENCGQYSEQYIREKLIELRNMSDRVRMAKCCNRPMKGSGNIMPEFHKRYPLRAHVDTQLQLSQGPSHSPTGVRVENKTPPNAHTPQTPSPLAYRSSDTGNRNQVEQRKLSSTSSTESGYITQESSSESLPTSVPPNTPISAPSDKPESKRLEYKLDRVQLTLALTDKQVSNKEHQKWEVLSVILEEIKDDLDSTDISLKEFADSSMYELGLDSLNVMQAADFLNKIYDIKMIFSDIIDYGTLGRLAEAVVKQSPVFRTSEASGESGILTSSSPTLLTPQTSLVPSNFYPTLTREGIYTYPPIEDVRKMQPSEDHSQNLHLYVQKFTIGLKGVGKIVFIGETDIAHLDLDKVMHIREREVHLSPDQPGSDRLNKPAMIYFENVHPKLNTTADHEALTQSLKEQCMKAKQPRQFLCYCPNSGQFIIKVEKFY